MSNLFGMLWFLILLEDRIGGSATYACMRRPPRKKAMKTTQHSSRPLDRPLSAAAAAESSSQWCVSLSLSGPAGH